MKREFPECCNVRIIGWLVIMWVTSASLVAGPDPQASDRAADHGSWKFATGVLWRRIGDVTFDDRHEPVPRVVIPPILYVPPQPGRYADGYVFDDSSGIGTTSDFGYDNDSQLGPGTLAFSGVSFMFRQTVDHADDVGLRSLRDDAGTTAAPYLSVTRDWLLNEKTRAGITLNFSVMAVEGRRNGASTFRTMERNDSYKESYIHVYNTGGTVLPAAPYRGVPDQDSPRIPTGPSGSFFAEPELVSTQTHTSTDSLDQQLDMDFYSLAFGACLEYEPKPRLGIRAGAGLVMNSADWRGESTHVATITQNDGTSVVNWRSNHRNSGTDILGGIYLETALMWRIDSRWSLECSARYDWNESLDGRIGPGGFNVDLDGWSVGLGVSYRY